MVVSSVKQLGVYIMLTKRLTELREKNKISKIDIAQNLKISLRSYQRYEKGERKPDSDILLKIAILFNVSTDYLLGLTNNPTTYEKMTLDSIICTTPQYSDAALDIARKYDEVTPDIQRRIERYVSGEYDDYCQSSAEKLIEKTGSYS